MKKYFYKEDLFRELTYLCIIFLFCIFGSVRISDSQILPGSIDKDPAVKKIGPYEYKIGDILLNTREKEIIIPGSINMQKGLIEYVACQGEIGKLHESILRLDAKPSHLQIALLLLGFKHKNTLRYQGDPNIPKGDKLDIWVEWELPGKKRKSVRAEKLVYNQKEKQTMQETYWVFTGSRIVDGQFLADTEGSMIATFNDPLAIINNPLPTGDDDTLYFCNEKLIPSEGTKITVTIRASERDVYRKIPDERATE